MDIRDDLLACEEMNGRIGPLLPRTCISPMTRIRVERSLPAPGEILVQRGQRVGASQKIARIPVRGEIRVVNVAHILDLGVQDLSQVMVKKRGDRVEAGEILAARRGVLPFWHKPCRAPIAGRLAAMGHGWVMIEEEAYPRSQASLEESRSTNGRGAEAKTKDLLALVAGHVAAVTDQRKVTIETIGAYIVGACGVVGEGNGVLQIPAKGPAYMLTADDIGLGSNNAVLVGGAGVSLEALARAGEMKIKGIIVGGISASLHDLIPAPPFPIVATEGYGNLPMSSVVFDILKRLEGHEVYISGYMGEGWDSVRPTIVVPLVEHQEDNDEMAVGTSPIELARVGDRVRVVRHPRLGQVGEIVSLPAESQLVPSGLSLVGAQVAFADSEHPSYDSGAAPAHDAGTSHPAGTLQFVPWLNLERIG